MSLGEFNHGIVHGDRPALPAVYCIERSIYSFALLW